MMELPRDTPITLRVLGGKRKAGGRSPTRWPPAFRSWVAGTKEWDRRRNTVKAWVHSGSILLAVSRAPSATYALSSRQRKLVRRRGREQGCGGSGGVVWPWCSGGRAR